MVYFALLQPNRMCVKKQRQKAAEYIAFFLTISKYGAQRGFLEERLVSVKGIK